MSFFFFCYAKSMKIVTEKRHDRKQKEENVCTINVRKVYKRYVKKCLHSIIQ